MQDSITRKPITDGGGLREASDGGRGATSPQWLYGEPTGTPMRSQT
jgi:hypothetical protein